MTTTTTTRRRKRKRRSWTMELVVAGDVLRYAVFFVMVLRVHRRRRRQHHRVVFLQRDPSLPMSFRGFPECESVWQNQLCFEFARVELFDALDPHPPLDSSTMEHETCTREHEDWWDFHRCQLLEGAHHFYVPPRLVELLLCPSSCFWTRNISSPFEKFSSLPGQLSDTWLDLSVWVCEPVPVPGTSVAIS